MANQGLGYLRRNDVLRWLVGQTATAPAGTQVALVVGDPGDDGQSGTEVSGGSYARVAVTLNTGWTQPTPTSGAVGEVNNTAAITFPVASGSWGTPTYVAIWTTSGTTAANFVARVPITTPQAIASGNTASIAIGALKLTMANGT